ncbi:MAG: methyltransferase [Chlorobi bacterium OLB5]|nr:MAG: methyltransferase [Chlorobi bacterium OLB5]
MAETLKTWRVLDILKVTEAAFADKGIKNPRLNAELLLCDITGDKRIELYLNFEKPLTKAEVEAYRQHVKRRLAFEPLQYILGKTEFYGLNFRVNCSVLIPRQETEILVEKALEYITNCKPDNPKILEIGTGSGCISAAIAANTVCEIDAVDVSPEAVNLATENASNKELKGKIIFSVKDLFNDINSFEGYDIVVSNPPYIAASDVPGLDEEVNGYEPVIALSDNDDGLSFYRKIFQLFNSVNKKPVLLLELGDGKKEQTINLLKENGILSYKIFNDLIGIPRVLLVESYK